MNTEVADIRLIAETAWHHEGNFGFMTNLLHDIGEADCADIIKMHITLDLDEYMSVTHPLYETLSGMMFDRNQWQDLVSLINKQNMGWMALVNDTEAVEFATGADAEILELHAVCLNDINLLDSVKKNISSDIELVLGVGGSSIYEIDFAINYLQHQNIILMFGFQNYPTNYSDINFNKIRKIMSLYPGLKYGYADHTAWDHPDNQLVSLLGSSLGMNYLEKHVTNQYGIERLDWQAAISVEQCRKLYEKLKILAACNGDGNLALNSAEKLYGHYGPMKKAACLNRSVDAGEVLARNDIVFRRCGEESDLSQLDALVYFNGDFRYARAMDENELLLKDCIIKGA